MRRNTTCHAGWCRAEKVHSYATARCARSRRNQRFGPTAWRLVQARLADEWSPWQIADRHAVDGTLSISHETIYRHSWDDRARGGVLYVQLRGARKQRRKRYGRSDSRGRLAGKPIADRPAAATTRAVSGRPRALGRRHRDPVRTMTVDNGTEFHSYAALEAQVAARFYCATPHHAWERGTNENTSGLLRQYWPEGESMAHLSQADCTRIATKLNRRPRKSLANRTPEECHAPDSHRCTTNLISGFAAARCESLAMVLCNLGWT